MKANKSRILEIAELVGFLASAAYDNKAKAAEVKLAIANGLITTDDGLDLIVAYTK